MLQTRSAFIYFPITVARPCSQLTPLQQHYHPSSSSLSTRLTSLRIGGTNCLFLSTGNTGFFRYTRWKINTKPQSRELWSSWSSVMSVKEEVDPGIVEGVDLRIVKYPHPALRAANEEITVFDASLAKLARDMFKLMYAAVGVGLAAPQVGINKRLMVYNPKGDPKAFLQEHILINPRITDRSKDLDTDEEGCLSFPNMGGKVERNTWIKVVAQRPNGKTIKLKLTGWEARIFQHEYDHLDGIVYIDRLSESERKRVQPRLDELIKDFDGPNPAV